MPILSTLRARSVLASALFGPSLVAMIGITGCDDAGGRAAEVALTAIIESCDIGEGIAPADVSCNGEFGGFEDAETKPQVTYSWTFGDEAEGTEGAEGVTPLEGKRPTHRYNEPGEYTITLTVTLVDSGQAAEATQEVTIRGAANLIVTSVAFEPKEIDSGDEFTTTFQVKNTGSATAANTDACVVIARSRPVTSNTGEILGFVETPGLDGGGEQSLSGTTSVKPTTATGSYFVGVCSDCNSVVDEGADNESDNCFEAEGTLDVTRKDEFPDLTGREIRPTPQHPFEGASTTVCFIAENIGERPVFGFDYTVWAVRGEEAMAVDPEDRENNFELRTGAVEILRPEDEERICEEIALPGGMTEGPYRLFVHMDSGGEPPDHAVQELSELNNWVRGEIPLVVERRVVDGVDLLPCSLDASPHQVASDGNLQVTACVCNRGRQRAIQHTYEFKLSPELSFDADGAKTLGVCNISELPAQECRTCSFQGSLAGVLEPGTLGQFFVCGRVDASLAVREPFEDNNDICDPEPITVGESTDVDLTIHEVSFGPVGEEAFECGRQLDYSITIANLAPSIASAFRVGLYLSPDDSIERTDFLLDFLSVPQLSRERTLTGQVLVPIDVPKQVGTWFVGAIIDPDRTVKETNEANNRAVAADALKLDPNTCLGGCVDDGYEPNDTVAQAARIGVGTHDGLCVGPDSGDDYYGIPLLAGESLTVTIGFDQISGDLDLELLDASGVNLVDRSATGANQETVRVALASSPALYFVRVRPASPEVESRYSMTIDIKPPLQGVDLAPANLQTSPRLAIVGAEISVRFDALNLGLHDIGTAFNVQLWARNLQEFVLDPECVARNEEGAEGEGEGDAFEPEDCDPVIGDDGLPIHLAYPLDSVRVAGVRPLGSTRVQTQVVIPPEAGPGSFAIVVELDSEDSIDEADETNNIGVGADIEHRVPPQDCVDNEDEHEPNNSGATALPAPDVPVANGDRAISDNLTVCEGFDDWWEYELEAGDELICDVTFQHGLGDIDLRLIGPDGQIVDESSTRDPREEVSVSGSPAGRYLLHVHYFGGGGDEPWNVYRLRCELNRCAADAADEAGGNDVCEDASVLTPVGAENASLCTGDTDWYCIDLYAGFPVTICAEPHSGAPDEMRLTLLQGCGDFQDNGRGCVEVSPRQDSTYCLRVQEANGRIKGYDLTVDGLDGTDVGVTSLVVSPAQVLPDGRPQVTAEIRNTLVQDVGSFTYEIRLSDDDEIDDNDALLRQWRREEDLPRGQEILVDTKVDLPDGTAPGDWWLGVRVIPDPDTVDRSRNNNQLAARLAVLEPCAPDARDPQDNNPPGLPAVNGQHAGSLCAGDTDWYAVQVGAGGNLVADLTFLHRDGDLDLFAYAWDGLAVGERVGISDGGRNRERIVLADLAPGTYLVQVLAPAGDENSYSLDLFTD